MMKAVMNRARSSPQKEREPFNAGPYRPKNGAPPGGSSSPGRRSRHNSENVPPDGTGNAPEGITSPVHLKSASKGQRNSKESLPSSPAVLPPKPPRPSPARAQSALGQLLPNKSSLPSSSHGHHDQTGSTKRKINWDVVPSGSSGEQSTRTDLDTGVKVIIRMRPLNKKEEAEEATQVVHKMSAASVALADQQFTYDAIVGENSSQNAVFEMVGLPMVENCLAGFNSSIFAYGQTGSGKTHTMWGVMPDSTSDEFPSNDRGLTPRVFERLFSRIDQEEKKNADKQLVYQCRCSFLEIYNEQITDLLDPTRKNLMIREDTKTGVYVDSLSEEYVSSVEDITRILVKGLANRRVGATTMNNESSRSHSIVTCVIESRSKSTGEGVSSVRSSRLNMVDLAGSERQKQTGSAGERLKEAGNINKSLSQLGNVINILAEVAQSGKHRHIPYRDSRLTFLLQESLGGNAKLAMICAVSPASSCQNETLSTLRFAQRAKAIQNKAVVNEEKANDVNLLREQIRQLKDELTRMKSSNTEEPASGSGYTDKWNARRSYNLLRLSLAHPMTYPLLKTDDDDDDEEMEVDNDLDDATDLSNSTDMELGPVQVDKLAQELKMSSTEEITAGSGVDSADTVLPVDSDLEDTPNSESPTLEIAKGRPPALDVTTAAVVDAPFNFHPPTQSNSPMGTTVKKNNGLVFGLTSLAENEYVSDFEQTAPFDGKAGLQSSLYSSKSLPSPSPRDRLAASLQKGLQILDNHQKSSLAATLRRSTNVRLSLQSADPKRTRTTERGVQTLPILCPNCSNYSTAAAVRSSVVRFSLQDSHPKKKARTTEMGIQTSPPKELLLSADWSNLIEVGCNTMLPDSPNSSLEMASVSMHSKDLVATPQKPEYAQAIEALLAGSIRRERAAEEAMTQQAAEIEQLNRLVRQYKHERECNSILQQSREDKIARLVALMDGVLPRETFLTEEWAALLQEHKTLQEKFDKHPEVTHAKVELERLLDELDRYKTFFDLGEREVLLQENLDLRTHLQTYLECGNAPGGAKHRRLSLTSQAIRTSAADLCLRPVPDASSSTAASSGDKPVHPDQLVKERQLWQERELEWLTIMDEIGAESEKFRLLAEKRKHELDGEKRCAKEVHDALEMAMEGHARLLEQYAELQEKHISLLAKNRKIREGVADLKKLAKKAGVTTTDTRWFECQAEQLVAMRIDHELEKDAAKDEVHGLQAQLRDTAEAVSAAGELLVRLKEAEDAICMAQDAAAMAGQEANGIRREMEKLQRKHATEMAALQQRLLEVRMQKPQLCPMCIMAERVKFEFTDVDTSNIDNAEREAAGAKKHIRMSASHQGLLSVSRSWNSGFAKDGEEESIMGEHEDMGNYLENLDIDEFVDEPL